MLKMQSNLTRKKSLNFLHNTLNAELRPLKGLLPHLKTNLPLLINGMDLAAILFAAFAAGLSNNRPFRVTEFHSFLISLRLFINVHSSCPCITSELLELGMMYTHVIPVLSVYTFEIPLLSKFIWKIPEPRLMDSNKSNALIWVTYIVYKITLLGSKTQGEKASLGGPTIIK